MFGSDTVYASTARYDGSGRAMTEDEMYKAAPSLFATTAHSSRSAKFAVIPTIEIIREAQKHGFYCMGVKQAVVRDKSRHTFCKHIARLRRLENEPKYHVGDTVCEILAKNANDGSSILDFEAALFRISCLNSLVVKTDGVDSFKVKHLGNISEMVEEGTTRVLQSAQLALEAPRDWPQIMLEKAERDALAMAAYSARFADADGKVSTPIKPNQLLFARRPEDVGDDLWRTFNVIQENCIKGDITASGFDKNNKPRMYTTREIKGIDQDVRLNRALFVLAKALADHKSA